MSIHRALIEIAMQELRSGNITLHDYNEILYILLGISNYTVNHSVHKFLEDNGIYCVQESTGWYIDLPIEVD